MSTKTTRVVVGVSPTLTGLAAIRVAVDEARLHGAELIAVRAWAFKSGWRDGATRVWRQEIARQAEHTLTAAFSAAMGGPPDDLPVQMIVCEGLPEKVLVAQADRADDLLVIGAPESGWHLNRTVVVRYCARRARCRLLVVPPPELARVGRTGSLARSLRREADGFARANVHR
ncbi:MAG TPA: universal stress protein [Micromonosporaceae bacterium]|nr:universal stress protein [Micromonosporaceae bacterium]